MGAIDGAARLAAKAASSPAVRRAAANLVQRAVQVTRGGKTFSQMRMVLPTYGKAVAAAAPKAASAAASSVDKGRAATKAAIDKAIAAGKKASARSAAPSEVGNGPRPATRMPPSNGAKHHNPTTGRLQMTKPTIAQHGYAVGHKAVKAVKSTVVDFDKMSLPTKVASIGVAGVAAAGVHAAGRKLKAAAKAQKK